MSVILGKDIETGTSVKIDDIARYGGLYILGKAGTGKSTLLVSMALQDIKEGNGLLFIDPHADAINKILERMPKERAKDVILLDPTDPNYAFGINPLHCDKPQNLAERELVFGQTRDIFAKLAMSFGESDEKLGVLLNKYLRNILYPLIENPNSTLFDITMMLTNKPFREHLLKNVKYNPDTIDFWHYQFDLLSKHDQYEELKSTFNRISLFQRQHIRDIISQPRSTIDFAEIMRLRKIILLKIPIAHDEEIRSFIGMLVISQLLKAIFLRTDISEQLRVPFAIYCDEFHNFATPDFAKLFAQTRKFKIMPVVAHQYRTQFKLDDPNKGATLASPNKVHFNLTEPDAEGFAKEVARKPPAETKQEQQMAISRSPVSDLLRGHVNPEIQQFVDRNLRPLQNWEENVKKDIEKEKLRRTERIDEAAIIRLEAQKEEINSSSRFRSEASKEKIKGLLTNAAESIERSLSETADLQILHLLEKDLNQNMRSLDRFLTTVMEKQITPRHKEFANFLTSYIENFPGVEEKHKQSFKMFIQLQYGNAAETLNQNERETMKNAYLGELVQGEKDRKKTLRMLLFINQFARFCDLLSKPENHIKKTTGQYIEKEIPLRTEADMVNEMRRELIGLPNYTAYAKIMQGKYKITTPAWYELPEKLPISDIAQTQQEILEQTHKQYSQSREIIEKQIREKQATWQKDSGEKPPQTHHSKVEKAKPDKSIEPPKSSSQPSNEEPPPPFPCP